MQKILIIGHVWPEPNSTAAGYHILSILRVFKQQGWAIEFATPAQRTEHMVDLQAEGISSRTIALNNDSFDTFILDYQPTIVLFDRFMMEEQFGWRVDQQCPNALKILDTEDLQCLRAARYQAYQFNRPVVEQDLMSTLAKREVAAILRCDIALIISSVEHALLIETYKVDARLLHHLPFMVDLSTLPINTPTFETRQHFISIGNFRHAPNWDSVLYLQSIWPKIRKRLPQAQLHIYGAYAPPKATALHNPKTGFLMKGWASNVADVMQQSRVCLAPLRFGAGLKGKLLDAMKTQTPSVTTSIGSEGMSVASSAWPGRVADDVDSLVDASVMLYQDKKMWQTAQGNIQCHLAPLNGEALASALLAKVADVQNNIVQHRLHNFTGAMLKHHTMTSSKYMSQWIMEKNKVKVDQ